MLNRFIWMAVLIVAMVVGTYGINTLEYASWLHDVIISGLTVIAMWASMKIVGLTLISQKWLDEVEIIDEEEMYEAYDASKEDLGDAAVKDNASFEDELTDLGELVEWKANQLEAFISSTSEMQVHFTERLDDLQAQINTHYGRIKELQDNAGLGELDEDE